jgi:hypothetical protein
MDTADVIDDVFLRIYGNEPVSVEFYEDFNVDWTNVLDHMNHEICRVDSCENKENNWYLFVLLVFAGQVRRMIIWDENTY